MAIRGWKMLEPIYHEHRGKKGRLSIQTDPTLNRSAAKMLEQARHFHSLAPNVQIKFPATSAGLRGHRAGHLRGHDHQRHRLLHGGAGARGGGGRRARAGAPRGRGPGQLVDGAHLHDHDRPHRRLGEEGLRAGRHHHRPGCRRLGRHRRLQACRGHLRGARLPQPPAGGRLPPPPALVGAHRRRHLDDHPGQLAAPLQRLRRRGQGPLARPGPGRLRRGAAWLGCPSS